MSKSFDCRVKNWSSTLREVPFHKNNKKEAGETDEESKKADDAGKEALEGEVSKHEYSRAVSKADSKKDHANIFNDKEHDSCVDST